MITRLKKADVEHIQKNLDKGFYLLAPTRAKDPGQFEGIPFAFQQLYELFREKGMGPTPDELDQRTAQVIMHFRGLRPKSADGVAWMPNANEYAVLRKFAEETWALDQLLAVQGIRTKGLSATSVDKFWATSENAALFPAYVESNIYAGIIANSLLPALTVYEQAVTGEVAKVGYLTELETDRSMQRIGEGSLLPAKQIKTGEHSIELKKYGMLIQASYEATRRMSADVLGMFVQRAVAQMGVDETDLAIEALIAGDAASDGNSNALTATSVDTSGTLDYDDLVKLELAFPQGYEMNLGVVHDGGTNGTAYGVRELLNLAEFKDPDSGRVPRTAGMPVPSQIDWRRWTSTGSSSFAADYILGIDTRYACGVLREGGLLQESDKLIDKQWERIAVSSWVGIHKVDENCAQALNCVA